MSAPEIAAIAALVTAFQVAIVAIIGALKAGPVIRKIDAMASRVLTIKGYVINVPNDPEEPATVEGMTDAESADVISEVGAQEPTTS